MELIDKIRAKIIFFCAVAGVGLVFCTAAISAFVHEGSTDIRVAGGIDHQKLMEVPVEADQLSPVEDRKPCVGAVIKIGSREIRREC